MIWKQSGGFLRYDDMEYRCVATSVAGFVQQLVSCYLPHGYWFYVSGFSRATADRHWAYAEVFLRCEMEDMEKS